MTEVNLIQVRLGITGVKDVDADIILHPRNTTRAHCDIVYMDTSNMALD